MKTNRKWKRIVAGEYQSDDGWVILQAQGERWPRWFCYPPGSDIHGDPAWQEKTLRDAKASVTTAPPPDSLSRCIL